MQRNCLLFFASSVILSTATVHAQDINEAYNLSNLRVQGTARSMGFGNALGSIGGDFSVTSVNPAGLGVYRSSEFTFTPTLRMNSASSSYLGVVTPDNNVRFNISNFGMVFTDAPKGKRYERRAWKAVSFAFGMNRVADFNTNYSYGGVNYTSSATQAFEADANQYPADALSENPLSVPGYIGFQAYLINPDSSAFSSIVPYKGGIQQNKTVRQRGRINEYTISLGGNYKEQLMLGATLGIPSIKYSINSTFGEYLAPGNTAANPGQFNSFSYNQKLDVTGTGVNLKLGAIYKINDNVRLGGAFHTPSVYVLNETYNPSIVSIVDNKNYDLSPSNLGTATNKFNYSFVTPWRGILSASYIMKGVGFITLDYEYVGYNSMGFVYPEGDGNGNIYAQAEYDMNQNISKTYKNTSNFRLGVEGLVTKFFMARAGFGYYGNPYEAAGTNGQRMDFSGGVGFREKNFFADLAFIHSSFEVQALPYSIDYNYVISANSPATIPTATTQFGLNTVAMTMGVKF